MDRRSISKRSQFLVARLRIDFRVWQSRYTCNLGSSLNRVGVVIACRPGISATGPVLMALTAIVMTPPFQISGTPCRKEEQPSGNHEFALAPWRLRSMTRHDTGREGTKCPPPSMQNRSPRSNRLPEPPDGTADNTPENALSSKSAPLTEPQARGYRGAEVCQRIRLHSCSITGFFAV